MSGAVTFALPRRRSFGAAYVLRLAAVALLASLVGYAAISVRVADGVTRATRLAVDAAPKVVGAAHESVTFRSLDGLALRGWFFPARPDRAVVLVHGRNSSRVEGGRHERIASFLLSAGYSVLLFDLRGHGESEGDRFSLGQHERKDVAGAIDHLAARGFAERNVALLGSSMGAGTALQTLALRPAVGAVIADSAYADGARIVAETATVYTGLPDWFTPGIVLASGVLFDLDLLAVDPIGVVRERTDRPFLFIHCADDGTVGVQHSRDLRAASAHPRSDLWVVPGCGHLAAYDRQPAEFERRVLSFLAANLP